MAYKLYPGSGGAPRRVRDEEDERPPEAEKRPPPDKRPGAASPPLLSGLNGLLTRLEPGRLEAEDLLVLAILYLLYRESGDREFLLAAAGYILL